MLHREWVYLNGCIQNAPSPHVVARVHSIAISIIDYVEISRVLRFVGLSKKVCFMAVTETAVNTFLDKKIYSFPPQFLGSLCK